MGKKMVMICFYGFLVVSFTMGLLDTLLDWERTDRGLHFLETIMLAVAFGLLAAREVRKLLRRD